MWSKGISVISVALLIVAVSANCPNSCSGHGTCGADDKCTCYPNFKSLDCSERVCAYQIAFADVAYGDNAAHKYMECSGKGICDRKSGLCKCFAGYEGEACRRTTCPNLCSGHGTCELMDEIAADTSPAAGGASGRIFTSWEAKKHQVCKCDPYWHGVDCSERDCPKGDDPLTTTATANEVQTITLSDGDDTSTNAMTGFFTLTFKDKFNGVWTTRPIKGFDGDAAVAATGPAKIRQAKDMELALNGLPNQVIQGLTVSAAVAATFKTAYTVTFSGEYNSGPQNALICNFAGCNVDGCQPRYAGIGGGSTPECGVVVTTAGTREQAVCSNRGDCDEVTGKCICFSGYFGESCNKQTALF